MNLKWSASLACISNTMDMTFSIIPLYTFLYMLNIMLFKLYLVRNMLVWHIYFSGCILFQIIYHFQTEDY